MQTASLLDVAGHLAQKTEDIESLLLIAKMYMELSEKMMITIEEDEEEIDEEALARKSPLGFCPQVDLHIVPDEEEEVIDE